MLVSLLAYHSMNWTALIILLQPHSIHLALCFALPEPSLVNRMVTTDLARTLILHCIHMNCSSIYQGRIVVNAYPDLGYPVAVHIVVILYQMSMFIHVNAVCDSLIL